MNFALKKMNLEKMEWRKDEYLLSTDKSKIDIEIVHGFLAHSYWAESIPLDVVKKSIDNSLCFAIYRDQKLKGFARVISDFATFAYLADVFIVPEERGKGLSIWLMETIMAYPQLQGLRRFTLATRDARGLYERFGFTLFDRPERWMQKHDPHVYTRNRRPVIDSD